jgi:hypothetical protein
MQAGKTDYLNPGIPRGLKTEDGSQGLYIHPNIWQEGVFTSYGATFL